MGVPAGEPFVLQQAAAFHSSSARVLHQGGVAAALDSGSLGVGFSGSGFLIMYFVGVTSVLRNLGIIDSRTRLAGSSGGSIASAVSCSGVSDELFIATAKSLATSCSSVPLNTNCRRTLDVVARAGMSTILPPDANSRCNGRLFVSVTDANANPQTDRARFISSFKERHLLIQALLASSYLPGFSGRSAVTIPTGLGIGAAYDGVCSNPLPVPPGVSYAITVSALAGPNPPTFDEVVVQANNNPALFDATGLMYKPLNPVVEPQPSRVDIYPGLSGPLPVSGSEWNQYVQRAPDNDMLQSMYDQGRQDAAAYVRDNIPSRAGRVSAALSATRKDVNSVQIPGAIEGAINAFSTAASNPLGSAANGVSNLATTLGNIAGK